MDPDLTNFERSDVEPRDSHMISKPAQNTSTNPGPANFKLANPSWIVVVRYKPKGRNNEDRKALIKYIEGYGGVARKDGKAGEKARDANLLSPEEKDGGFLAFDFEDYDKHTTCRNECDGQKVLGRITIRAISLPELGWLFFDGAMIYHPMKKQDSWFINGRGEDHKRWRFPFDEPPM